MIPERSGQKERRRRQGGSLPLLNRDAYYGRNVVKRCVTRFKQWHGVATRYEKRPVDYRAVVVIAALMIWLTS